jgi:adenylate kinase family enzyme
LITREDDKESVIRERLHEYDSQTLPILKFFKDQGVSLFEIDSGEDSPQRILEKIREALASLDGGVPQESIRL